MDILELTKQYLLSKKGHWPEIEKATGISTQWMSNFVRGFYKSNKATHVKDILEYARAEGWVTFVVDVQQENKAA